MKKENLLQNEKSFVWWNMRSYIQYDLWEHVCQCYCLLKQFDWARKSVLVWEKWRVLQYDTHRGISAKLVIEQRISLE